MAPTHLESLQVEQVQTKCHGIGKPLEAASLTSGFGRHQVGRLSPPIDLAPSQMERSAKKSNLDYCRHPRDRDRSQSGQCGLCGVQRSVAESCSAAQVDWMGAVLHT